MKKILILGAVLCLSAIATAQTLNFSGNWKLNNTKSKLNQEFTMAPGEIIIAQKGNDMSVERHSNFQGQEYITNDKFTLDGKECINPGWMDLQKKSTLVWSDDKNSLKVTTKFAMNDGGEMIITEVYTMDSGNMIIESTASSSYGDMSETMVYDKQ
jgi:hypothetical protein